MPDSLNLILAAFQEPSPTFVHTLSGSATKTSSRVSLSVGGASLPSSVRNGELFRMFMSPPSDRVAAGFGLFDLVSIDQVFFAGKGVGLSGGRYVNNMSFTWSVNEGALITVEVENATRSLSVSFVGTSSTTQSVFGRIAVPEVVEGSALAFRNATQNRDRLVATITLSLE